MKTALLTVVAVVLALIAIVAGTYWGSDAPPANAASPRPTATAPLWAVVNLDISAVPPVASLARGSGAVAAVALGTDGSFEVTFNRDVSGCAYVATAGESASNTPGPDDAITFGVAPRAGNLNAVYLLEYDAILARDSYSSGFHLVVTCP